MSTAENITKTGKILTMSLLGLTVVGLVIGLIAYLVRKKKREKEEQQNKSLGYSSDSSIKDSNVRRDTEITKKLGDINVAQMKTIMNTTQALNSLNTVNSGTGLGI